MSNLHEYVIFDRAEFERLLKLKWQDFEKVADNWLDFYSAREYLTEFGVAPESVNRVDEILSKKTLRQTFPFASSRFSFLYELLSIADICSIVTIPKRDDSFADQMMACAVGGFERGQLSLPTLGAVYHLHDGWIESELLPPDVVEAIQNRPEPKVMMTSLPDVMEFTGAGLSASDTKRFISFLVRAWDEKWPVSHSKSKLNGKKTIRSCEVAKQLVETRYWSVPKPCIFHWFEC